MAFLFWSDDVRCLSVLFYAGFLLKEVLRGVFWSWSWSKSLAVHQASVRRSIESPVAEAAIRVGPVAGVAVGPGVAVLGLSLSLTLEDVAVGGGVGVVGVAVVVEAIGVGVVGGVAVVVDAVGHGVVREAAGVDKGGV